MVSKWKAVKLGDVLTLQRGYDLPSQKREPGDIPIISSSGVTDYHNEAAAQAPGVITGRYGTIGEVFYSSIDYWPLNTTLYVKDFKGNYPKFIFYLLKSIDFHRFNDKSSVPGVNRNHAHMAEVRVPDFETQLQIADVLSVFDDKIELNRQMNRTLEQMARALFKSWFIDFDPVYAKQRGEQPEGMDADTAALFPDRFVEVDGKEVPERWEWKKVQDVVDILYGKALKAENRMIGDIPVYGSNGPIGFHNQALARGPGIILGRKGNPGIVSWSHQDFFPIDTAFYVKPKDDFLSLEHIYFTLDDLKLSKLGGDSAVPGLNRDTVYLQPYLVPSDLLIERFEKLVSGYRNIIHANEVETATLSKIRDSLLPRLLSGELDVSGWETALKAPEATFA